MTDMNIPTSPEAITPEWLTSALRETGVITADVAVSSVEWAALGTGQGFATGLAKLAVHYNSPEAHERGAPSSIVAKFPSSYAPTRQFGVELRIYEREVRFYEELAPEVELWTPRRYFSALDDESGDFVLLLEDLDSGRIGDQVAGCSLDEAEMVIRQLAGMHADWWGSPRLREFTWLGPFNASAERSEQMYPMLVAAFSDSLGHILPGPALEVCQRLTGNVASIKHHLAGPPWTLLHGDFRLDNILFYDDAGANGDANGNNGGRPIAVIDWQGCRIGRGVYDVAYFISTNLQPHQQVEEGMDLLRTYHATLVENGVEGYDFDECLHDYLTALLEVIVFAVELAAVLDLSSERGQAVAKGFLTRLFAAVLGLKAGDLLPGG